MTFSGFSERSVEFLWGIRLNNDRGWFLEHREDYRRYLEAPMKALGELLQREFCGQHPELMLTVKVSRIYRDARRLFGRGPYKDHLWLSAARREGAGPDAPCFWFELGPEEWGYGMGIYMPSPGYMAKHRARMDKDPQPLMELDRLMREGGFALSGESYRRPKGSGGELSHWYNLRSFSVERMQEVGPAIESPELGQQVTKGFEFLLPFYRYFSSIPADPEPVSGRMAEIGRRR